MFEIAASLQPASMSSRPHLWRNSHLVVILRSTSRPRIWAHLTGRPELAMIAAPQSGDPVSHVSLAPHTTLMTADATKSARIRTTVAWLAKAFAPALIWNGPHCDGCFCTKSLTGPMTLTISALDSTVSAMRTYTGNRTSGQTHRAWKVSRSMALGPASDCTMKKPTMQVSTAHIRTTTADDCPRISTCPQRSGTRRVSWM
mmetsp:Transcript_35759/g.91952  ORF Transcript_35759/g.91952 Transcript_35759/m.91952 type:complete len:201 (-) Transcript_35759:192-794(-)